MSPPERPETMRNADPPASAAEQERAYHQAVAQHGRELSRFVAGYERDTAKRMELLQDVHVALWQSLAGFRGQCSLRTWAFRVAHNVGATYIQRSLRVAERSHVDLEDVESLASGDAGIESAERRIDLERVLALIHRLRPPDREVMLLYLEDLDAASIGEITGLSARNVATKVHRIKALLSDQLRTRGRRNG
jgi:RNA polymerase sigma-70 factor (ECF subfamily)